MAMLEEVYGPEYLTACRRDDVLGQRGVGMMGRPGEQVPVTKGTFNLANSGTVDVHLPYPGGMDQTVRVARATDSSPAVYTARSVTSDLPSYRMMNSPNGVPEPYLLRTQRPPGFRPHVPLHASPTTFDRRQPVQRLPTVEGFERDGWQWPARPRPSYPLLCDQVQIHTRYCEVCREHAARMCKSSSAVGGAGNESLWWFWAFLAIVILVIVGIELMRWFKQGFSSWPIAPSMASSLGSSVR